VNSNQDNKSTYMQINLYSKLAASYRSSVLGEQQDFQAIALQTTYDDT
jgi:hypothetical protein